MTQRIFTRAEERIIKAMYELGRPATIYEIAKWADSTAWSTAKKVLKKFYIKKIVTKKTINGKAHWIIKEF